MLVIYIYIYIYEPDKVNTVGKYLKINKKN
jgi:hypothetical protein